MAIPQMDPTQLAQLGVQNPFAPPVPPPPSPSVGFQQWASDPRNAMKVQSAMTPPDAPLQPGLAAANPPKPAPMASAAPPSAPSPLVPPSNPQLQQDQAELQRLQTTGAGVNQVKNPVLRTLGKVGDIASMFLLGRGSAAIPGTTAHNLFLQQQAQGRVGNDIEAQNSQIDQRKALADIANIQSEIESRNKPKDKFTPIETDSGYVAFDPVTAQAQPIMDATGSQLQGKAPKVASADQPLSAQDVNSLNAIWNPIAAKHKLPVGQFRPGMTRAEATTLAGALNNAIGKSQGDQHISISLQGLQAKQPLSTDDPNMKAAVNAVANGSMRLQDVFGRGATTAQKAQFAAAVKQVNPNWNSGDNAIENEARKYFITGQGGQTLNAGQTLTHHLDLYDKAVDAMHNGDIRSLNAIGNELGVQTGKDAKTNLNLIQQSVAMEAARFWTGGVPGEAEVDSFAKSLNGDGSPQQMHGGANTIRGLARGKLKALEGQAAAGGKGQANFGGMLDEGGSNSGGVAHYVYVPGKGLVKQ